MWNCLQVLLLLLLLWCLCGVVVVFVVNIITIGKSLKPCKSAVWYQKHMIFSIESAYVQCAHISIYVFYAYLWYRWLKIVDNISIMRHSQCVYFSDVMIEEITNKSVNIYTVLCACTYPVFEYFMLFDYNLCVFVCVYYDCIHACTAYSSYIYLICQIDAFSQHSLYSAFTYYICCCILYMHMHMHIVSAQILVGTLKSSWCCWHIFGIFVSIIGHVHKVFELIATAPH